MISKIRILLIIASILLPLYLGYKLGKSHDSINFEDQATIDSLVASNRASEISLSTYRMMNDKLSRDIKDTQKMLNIKDRDLRSANRIIARLRSKVVGKGTVTRIDTITKDSVTYYCDSINLAYKDAFTDISVHANTCRLDSVTFDYSMNTSMTIISHTQYRKGNWFFTRFWNRLWKLGKHTKYSIVTDNPNIRIDSIKSIIINE